MRTLQGTASYEFRGLTPQGYSRAIQSRPARFVTVIARDARGAVLAQTSTDGQGRFQLSCPATVTALSMRASVNFARPAQVVQPGGISLPSMHIDVAPDREGRQPHEATVAIAPANSQIQLRATLNEPQALGGAFHILDSLVTAMQTVFAWSQQELPPFFVIWSHASGTDWSYYRGERPEGSHRYALELMAGVRGRLETTDADQHDIFIILHEFGHFVFDQLSSDSSIGGFHPATVLTDPGVAWEEGRATWFACAVLNDSLYRDAVGIEPTGSLRQNDDLEQLPADALRGLGSQRTVEEILWDLSDGTPTLANAGGPLTDRDSDGVALGPATVFRAMMALRNNTHTLPSLLTFLRELVQQNLVPEPSIERLLASPQPQHMSYIRLGQEEAWPFLLSVGSSRRTAGTPQSITVNGKVDGLTDPAPSGGRANPVNGFDAVRVYRFTLTQRAQLRAALVIRGSGRPSDDSDLDLELRDNRANLVTNSAGSGSTESITRTLEPGLHLLYVRDGGGGNAANFTLSVTLSPP